jgi:hypothetical protein
MIIQKWTTLLSSDKMRRSSSNHSLEPCSTADVYPIKSDKQFVNTLLDNITQRGAPTKLISDRAQVEISERVKQVLRPLHISTWQSKPHQQHQNPAERQYQNIK